MGYRGEEIDIPQPDEEFRIVCLGGTTAYTGKVDDYKMSYPYLLGKNLEPKGNNDGRQVYEEGAKLKAEVFTHYLVGSQLLPPSGELTTLDMRWLLMLRDNGDKISVILFLLSKGYLSDSGS